MDTLTRIVADLLTVLKARELVTGWTRFSDGVDLIAAIEDLAKRLDAGDASAEGELTSLFAPTGALQEAAIDSDFSDEYMRLADRLDRVSKKGHWQH